MPNFKPSGGFKMKSPALMKATKGGPIHQNYGSPMKDYSVGKGSHEHPHSPAKNYGSPMKEVKKMDILGMGDEDRKNRTDAKNKAGKKRTFAEAYKKRDMKTYGNLSQAEYTKEAKRQTANKKATTVAPKEIGTGGDMTKGKKGSWDAPKSQMKGSVVGPKTKGGDATPKKEVKTTTTTKTTPKVTVKKPKTVKEARAARKLSKQNVRATRKKFGRGSAEVKAAKTTRKAAKQGVKTAKGTRRAVKRGARDAKAFIKDQMKKLA